MIASSGGRLRGFYCRACIADITRTRQVHGEDGTLADHSCHIYDATQPGDNTVHQRKTKPCADADFLGGKEWIEDPLENLGRNAASRIDDLQHYVISGEDSSCGRGARRIDPGALE